MREKRSLDDAIAEMHAVREQQTDHDLRLRMANERRRLRSLTLLAEIAIAGVATEAALALIEAAIESAERRGIDA